MNLKTEKQLFNYVWTTRPHFSELTGKPLLPVNHFKWHWQFAHILPKGSYPKFRLNSNNIILVLPDEHDHQEQYDYFNEKKLELTREYYEKYYGKKFD